MRVLATYVLVILYCTLRVCDVMCETINNYQCKERQILNTIDLPDFYWDKKYCSIETQEQSLRKTDCTVWDFGEESGYHDCSDLQFSSPTSSYVLGTEIYPNVEAFPNFIINFVNIKWNFMQYRLQVDQSKKCHKVWFNSTAGRDALSISFACKLLGLWAADENLNAELLVDVGTAPSHVTAHAHYMMKVPPSLSDLKDSASLKDWFILVAVDVSQKPYLLVHWPTVPDRFNVSEYHVDIDGSERKVVDLSFCRNGYCSCELFAGYFARNVTISVQPVHKDCSRSCYSYSPVITLETYLPLHITVPTVLVLILTFVFLIFCVYYFWCTAPRPPPTVLLLFDATTQHHRRVVYQLAEYLKDFCGVNSLLDNVEIPLSESQNAYKWLHQTINDADTILYIASPASYLDIRFSEYPNVVYEALRLIQQRRSNQTDNRSRRFLVAVPPYCSEKNIPSCLLDVPRVYIPKELKWLLWCIYNQKYRVAPLTWMAKAFLRCCWCPGPMSAYRLNGTRLKRALGIANAHKITEEGVPLGDPSIQEPSIEGTRIGGFSNDDASIYPFPGNLNNLHLLGKVGGSLTSQDSVVSKMGIDIDTMACGYNTHKIPEEGGSKNYENISFVSQSHYVQKPDAQTSSKRVGGSLSSQDNVIYNMCIDTLAL